MLSCRGISCDQACLYKMFWCALKADLDWILWQIGWRKKFFVCEITLFCKSAWLERAGIFNWFNCTYSYEHNIRVRVLFSWFIMYIGIWKYFFSCAIVVKHMMHFWYLFSLIFGIGTVDGWSIVVLKKWTVSLSIFSFGHLVLIIERYWQRSDQKNNRYNSYTA